jgi:hypothetical protein
MQYAQLNEDGSYSHQITTSGNVLWDENNFCPAAALINDGKAEQFRVVELHEVDPPAIDPMTQSVVRDGGELVDGQWRYKWRVDDLSPEQIAENIAAKERKLKASIIDSTQKRLDSFAQTRGYDGILSACTYANDEVQQFAVEGHYCVASRGATWAKLYEIMAEVEAGTRPVPSSYAEIEPELPALVWPE